MGLTKGAKLVVKAKYMKEAVVLNIRGSRVVLGMAVADNIQVDDVVRDELPLSMQPNHRWFRHERRRWLGGNK